MDRNKREMIPMHHSEARVCRAASAARASTATSPHVAHLPAPAHGARAAPAACAASPRRCALALSSRPGAGAGAAQNTLPALGDSDRPRSRSAPNASWATRSCARSTPTPTTSTIRCCSSMCRRIWQPLVAASRALGNITPEIDERFAWQPFLVRDPSVNAFALPGGFVGVHLGLIAVTASRDELASVLGHEMSHVTQRHIARSITATRSARWSAWRRSCSACSQRRAAATPMR